MLKLIPIFLKKYLKYSGVVYLLLFITIFTLYASFLSKQHNFDSVELALLAEKGYFFSFLSGHLLRTVLNKLWYDIWKFFGYKEGALVPLQILDVIFGTLGVVLFFIFIKNITSNIYISLISSLGLAFSLGYWHYSREVETHIIPCALFILCLVIFSKIDEDNSIKYFFLLGFIHSLLYFLSIVYLLFLPTFLAFSMLKGRRLIKKLKYVFCYLASLLTIWLIPLSILGSAWYKSFPKLGINVVHKWLMRMGGIVSFIQKSVPQGLGGILNNIIPLHLSPTLTTIILLFCTLFLFLLIMNLKEIFKLHSKEIIISLISIFSFAPFIIAYSIAYSPGDIQHFVPLLIFAWLIFALSFEHLFSYTKAKLIRSLPCIFVSIIFTVNLLGFILPTHNPANNYSLQRSYFIKENTNFGDLIVFVGTGDSTLDSMYIPYFAKREPFSFYRFYTAYSQPFVKYYDNDLLKALDKRINMAFKNGYRVFALAGIFEVDKPYETMFYFKWPISNREIVNFLQNEYSIIPYLKFKNETVYEIRKKRSYEETSH